MQAGILHHRVIEAGAGGFGGALEEGGEVYQGAEAVSHAQPPLPVARRRIGLVLVWMLWRR